MQIIFLWILSVVMILAISPISALILMRKQWNTLGIIWPSIIYSAIGIFTYMVLVVTSRSIDYSVTRILYYVVWLIVFGFTIAVVYRIVYGLLAIGWYQQVLLSSLAISVTLLIWLAMISIALYNFWKPITVKTIDIVSPHVDAPVEFVYFADTQFGSTTKSHLDKTITLINSLDPAFIMFGWDLVDFDDYEHSDFEILSTLQVPFYFITGNHEYYHQSERVIWYIQDYPQVVIMDDLKVTTESWVEVIGVDYRHAKSQASYQLTLDDLAPSPDRFSAFMFHEPKRVETTADRGYDLQMYGHTHGWQIFPGTLISRATYGIFSHGFHLLQKTNTRVYTTTGAGLWGPRMRLGSQNEVVVFRVLPVE